MGHQLVIGLSYEQYAGRMKSLRGSHDPCLRRVPRRRFLQHGDDRTVLQREWRVASGFPSKLSGRAVAFRCVIDLEARRQAKYFSAQRPGENENEPVIAQMEVSWLA